MSGTRRVEWILSQYTEPEAHGVSLRVAGSFPLTHLGIVFAKSSSEMVDALVEGKTEGEEGKIGHVAEGVSEGVARTMGLHDNLVLSRPAGSEGR
ncbi:unnamed protein product [Lasius platythorax]|uniref:Uncharacterized protein n=1 Tax=Lasius platythorax TaxID=488582 RepID=A0AAV2NX66_9HYME